MTEPAYGALSLPQRRLYRELQRNVESFQTEYVFQNTTFEEIGKVFQAVLADHPGYFWLSGSSAGTVRTMGNLTTVYFRPSFTGSASAAELRREKAALDAKADGLVALARRHSSVLYEQIVFLHDSLVRRTDYRMNAPHCYDAYGCLVLGKAVCAGYAAAFQLLMERLGVECGRIHGRSASALTGETSHEWNYIRLPAGCCFIDVTWDDPVVSGGGASDNLSHAFFGLGLRELRLTHQISSDQKLPSPICDSYDYYRYYGRYLERYSFEAVRTVAQRQLARERSFSVKFGTSAQTDAALRDLMDRQRVFELPGVSGRLSYGVSKSGLVLEVRAKS